MNSKKNKAIYGFRLTALVIMVFSLILSSFSVMSAVADEASLNSAMNKKVFADNGTSLNMADKGDVLTMEENVNVKKHFQILAYCSSRVNSHDDMLVYKAVMNGSWNGDVGDNFRDSYYNKLTNKDLNANIDCGDYALIKDAFNYFASHSTEGSYKNISFDAMTLTQKKEFFCGPKGWMDVKLDKAWSDEAVTCEDMFKHLETGGEESEFDAYYFTNKDSNGTGIRNLAAFVKENYFKNSSIQLTTGWADTSIYIIYRSFLSGHCSHNGSKKNPGFDNSVQMQEILQTASGVSNTPVAYVIQETSFNAQTLIGSGGTIGTNDYISRDCNNNGQLKGQLLNDSKFTQAYFERTAKNAYFACANILSEQMSIAKTKLADLKSSGDSKAGAYEAAYNKVVEDNKALLRKNIFTYDYAKLTATCESTKYRDEIRDQLNAIAPTDASNDPTAPVTPSDSDIDSSDEEFNSCESAGGADSMGWIICPILRWLDGATDTIYDEYVEPQLVVQAGLFSLDDTGTRHAWKTFQSIANICFVILLLIVIISQVTGVGIDNYGIKKILPKVILAAVLVNVSYYICVLAVDASNLIGHGLRSIFDELVNNGGLSTIDATISNQANNVSASVHIGDGSAAGETALSALALFGGIVGAGAAVWANPAILLSLLVTGLGILVSILFLFLILAVRKAGLVILVVASPLALLCYMLPNTQSLYKKWFKLFKDLLLVYPICALMIGGGNYVSRLLMTSTMGGDGFMSAFTAMIVGIAPVFFIPTVLRGSLSAMGVLGSKISGLGDKAKSGTTRKIRESNGYKGLQQSGIDRKIRKNAGIKKDGSLNFKGRAKNRFAMSSLGKMTGYARTQSARIAQNQKNVDTRTAETAQMIGMKAKDELRQSGLPPAAYFETQFVEAAEKGDTKAMEAAIDAAVSSGYMKDKDIAAMVRRTMNGNGTKATMGKDGSIDRVMGGAKFKNDRERSAALKEFESKYRSGFLGTDYELAQYMRNGGGDVDGRSIELGDYGDFAAKAESGINPHDFKPGDIIKQSGDSLAGLITSGKIDRSTAQSILEDNPDISVDKRIMLGMHSEGRVPQNISAGKLKTMAQNMATAPLPDFNDPTAVTDYMNSIVPQGANITLTADDIKRWTSPPPKRVIIDGGSNGGPTFTPSNTGGNTAGNASGTTGNAQPNTGSNTAGNASGTTGNAQPNQSFGGWQSQDDGTWD